MRLKIFDVVELKNGNKATILQNIEDYYKVEVVDSKGIRQDIKYIKDDEIKNIILAKL